MATRFLPGRFLAGRTASDRSPLQARAGFGSRAGRLPLSGVVAIAAAGPVLTLGLPLLSSAFSQGESFEPEPVQSAAVRSAAVQSAQAGGDPLREALAESGLHFDGEDGWLAFETQVGVVDQALEYLLVAAGGARHEALLTCEVEPSIVNAALLALGLAPGNNATWNPVGEELVILPGETEADLDLEAEPWRKRTVFEVSPPSGDGMYLHLAWRRGEELFFQRVEDVLVDAERDRPMRRHRFVYLGSEWIDGEDGSVFAADRERNLISVALFSNGYVLLTPGLPECERQDGWYANPWLLPERGQPLLFIASRERLTALPEGSLSKVPDLGPEPGPDSVRSSSATSGSSGPTSDSSSPEEAR